MSGLALIAVELGATVTGSDRADSPYLARVRAAGIDARVGHDAANVPAGDDVELVVSTAIAASNPERAVARARGLREIHRGALLGELSRLRRTIAIAGTHGKTTTASMATHALLRAGWDPSYVIGGELRTTGTNAGWGVGRLARRRGRRVRSLVPGARAGDRARDEHRARPPHDVRVARGARAAFAAFLRNGLRVVVADTPGAEAFLDRVGIVDAAFFGASEIELHAGGSRFAWAGVEVSLVGAGRAQRR